MENFFAELKRRKVYKVAIAYAIVTVGVASDDSAELNRKVDQLFAAYDKPDAPGCVLGVIRDGKHTTGEQSQTLAFLTPSRY